MKRTDASGQALVESAIVVPLLLFLFLCTLQIMMIAHTRVMLEYAAFNAARAGVVHNGSQEVMRNAALLSLVPTFPNYLPAGDDASVVPRFLRSWAVMRAWAGIGDAVDSGTASIERFLSLATGGKISFNGMFPSVSVVSVDILNPGPTAFKIDQLNPSDKEIDFDLGARYEPDGADGKTAPPQFNDLENLQRTMLTIRVVYLYQLRVPLADRFIWYLYMVGAYTTARLQKAQWNAWWELKGSSGADIKSVIDKTTFATNINLGDFANGAMALVREQIMFQALKQVPALTGLYLMPMFAIHTMPMESNLFRENLDDK